MVFLNTGQASPLTAAEKTNFEAYFRKGGGFVGIGSAIETDPSWQFLTDVLARGRKPHRASGRHGEGLSTASTTRARVAALLGARRPLVQLHDECPGRVARARDGRRGPVRPAAARRDAERHRGRHDGRHHPVSFCKDYQGGRSFYTALGNTEAAYDATLTTHLKGAITWATGGSDPEYSDCGATVLKNFQQTKIGSPPNLQEPIGFDQLPDGRVLQTDRLGSLRLHNPTTGITSVIANFNDPALPPDAAHLLRGEDGLYGPAVDANFATNKWVYLFYSPQTRHGRQAVHGRDRLADDAEHESAQHGGVEDRVGPVRRLPPAQPLQVRRGRQRPAPGLHSEQQIMRVPMNRQECCHVAGDIDFDKHGNLWMVTGDDTPPAASTPAGTARSTRRRPTSSRPCASRARPPARSR